MSGEKDYYIILGVSREAGEDEIKTAYRKLVKQFHPDVCDGDKKVAETRFKEVSEAYEVLIDRDKRRMYDTYGHAGIDRSWGSRGFSWQDFSHIDDLEDIFGSDIFFDFFGGSNFGNMRPGGRKRGASLRMTVSITLEEAFSGVEKELEVPHSAACPECGGTGAEGNKIEKCSTCGGQGQVRSAMSVGFGSFVTITTCPRCGGRGRKIKEKCRECSGRGTVEKTEAISVSIPEGADDGLRMRISGKGEAGMEGGPSGDLYVQVQVEPHKLFKREDDDLYMELPISFTQAVFGDEIEVPVFGEKAALEIPEHTQSNAVFRIQGRGMPSIGNKKRGDLYVRVAVKTPANLTPRQRELLQEFASISGEKAGRKGLFKKLTGRL